MEIGFPATFPSARAFRVDQERPLTPGQATNLYDAAELDVTLGGPHAPGYVRLPACPSSGRLTFVAVERFWTGRTLRRVSRARC